MIIDRSDLHFPFPTPPAPGEVISVADGVLWTRLPLPFSLNHINIYLIEDNGGWAVLDTGISNDATRTIWQALQAGPLKGMRLTRIIVSHFHPDHVGLANWLCRTFDAPLVTNETCYTLTSNLTAPGSIRSTPTVNETAHYLSHGLAPFLAETILPPEARFAIVSDAPPAEYIRIEEGDTLSIGGRDFAVLSGNGHAKNQLMLHAPDDELLFAADQIMARITPNVGVSPDAPYENVLDDFITTLKGLIDKVSESSLILPGHERPFEGIASRAQQLIQHHEERCWLILQACDQHPHSAADLLPILFTRPLDHEQIAMAFGEALAHVNYLVDRGDLHWVEGGSVRRLTTVR